MSTARFQEPVLVARLSRQPPGSIVAFALCCATRQFSAYEQFARRFDPEGYAAVHAALDVLWSAVMGDSLNTADVDGLLNTVMNHFPPEQDHWAPFHVYAEHALSSLAYTIRCILSSNPTEAAWSARCAYEAADQAAIRDSKLVPGPAIAEDAILKHPIVQRELQRQERDLILIENGESKAVRRKLRENARTEFVVDQNEMSK